MSDKEIVCIAQRKGQYHNEINGLNEIIAVYRPDGSLKDIRYQKVCNTEYQVDMPDHLAVSSWVGYFYALVGSPRPFDLSTYILTCKDISSCKKLK